MSKDLKDDENKSEEKPHKSYNLISSLIHPHPSNILSITSRLPQYNLLPYSPFQLDPLGKNFYPFPRFLPSPNVEIKKIEIPKNKEDDIKDDIKILKEQVKSLIEEKNIDKKETNKKMNEFQQKIEGQINSLKLQIELQFNHISSMISDLRKSQEQKYDILAKKIDDIDGKISNLERRVEKLEKNSKKIKMGIIKTFSELDE